MLDAPDITLETIAGGLAALQQQVAALTPVEAAENGEVNGESG